MSYIIGNQAKAYWSATALTDVTESHVTTWLSSATLAGNLMDLTLEIDSEFVDATTRAEAAQGFASEIAVLKGGRITFEARWQPGDAMFDALIAAWNDPTNNDFAMVALDQLSSVTGTQGIAANWSVSLNRTEPLRDIMKSNVTLAIASYPSWYKKTS